MEEIKEIYSQGEIAGNLKDFFTDVQKKICGIMEEVFIDYDFKPNEMVLNILPDDVYEITVNKVVYARMQIKLKFLVDGIELKQLEPKEY